MFRHVTQLKALAIDLDSFSSAEAKAILSVPGKKKLLFSTSAEKISGLLKEFPETAFIRTNTDEAYILSPSPVLQSKIIHLLSIQQTEFSYVSKNLKFCKEATMFYSGVILIGYHKFRYENMGCAQLPDFRFSSVDDFVQQLRCGEIAGYLGEVYYQRENTSGHKASVIPFSLEVDGEEIPAMGLGRYFGKRHYMYQLSPFTSALWYNKKGDKTRGAQNRDFAFLFSLVIRNTKRFLTYDAIISVPPHGSNPDRFAEMIQTIQKDSPQLEKLTSHFHNQNLSPQKNMQNSAGRRENASHGFIYDADLSGRKIILIDDIITTGSTLRECVKELKRRHAQEIFVIVLAVNQMGIYWSAKKTPRLLSREQKPLMLYYNSRRETSFFYASGLSFADGYREITKKIEQEELPLW